MRRAAKVDENQKSIGKLARRMGYSVKLLHMVGEGFPDMILAQWGLNFLIEVKNYDQPLCKRKLTTDQQDFHLFWKGIIDIVESDDDFLKWDKKQRAKVGKISVMNQTIMD